MAALRIENYEDSEGNLHPLNFDTRSYAVAYYKGERGHFYLLQKYSSFEIVHVNQRRQIKPSNIIDFDFRGPTEEENEANIPDEEVLWAFEDQCKAYKVYRYVPKNRDTQRKRAYTWETCFGHFFHFSGQDNGLSIPEFLNPEKTRELIVRICSDMDLTIPKIKYFPMKDCGAWAKGGHTVQFSDESTNMKTIIHEMAHIAHDQRYRFLSRELRGKQQGHGPEWVGIYIRMLESYLGYDVPNLERIATQTNVKFDYVLATGDAQGSWRAA